jgi:hypothetical protein
VKDWLLDLLRDLPLKLWDVYLAPSVWADRKANETLTPFGRWCRENGHPRGTWISGWSFQFDPALIPQWHAFNAKTYGTGRWSNWRYFLANTPDRWRLGILRTFAIGWTLFPFVGAVVWPIDYLCHHLTLGWTP